MRALQIWDEAVDPRHAREDYFKGRGLGAAGIVRARSCAITRDVRRAATLRLRWSC